MSNFFRFCFILSSMAATALYARSATEKVQTGFFDLLEKDVVTVTFDPNSAELTAAQQEKVRSLVNAAKRDGRVDKVIIAAWSDRRLPAGERELSKSDRELAEKRADRTKAFLKDASDVNVESYTMAEKENWFERLFNTSDAEVKKAMRGGETDNEKYKRIAAVLKDKGGPSTVVVIVKRAGEEIKSAP